MAGVSTIDVLCDGAERARWTVVLAHGAGQPMDSPFMNAFATGLADDSGIEGGACCVRFEFPYMAAARHGGKRGAPDREPVLIDTWQQVIETVARKAGGRERLVIGGKSLGGRIASMVAADEGVAGVVCLGYPFHPPGRPDRLRTGHLEKLAVPVLICQGERDPFGTPDEVAGYRLPANISVRWLADGDHGFRPRKASGLTETDNWNTAVQAIAEFLAQLAE